MVKLTNAIYGKDKIRVFRVVRNGPVHEVAEYNVCALLQGDIETSYTKADNSVVVPTDTVKNTTYLLAKSSPHVLDPVLFALHLGIHFVTTYPHISKSQIQIERLKWSRIVLPNKPEGHNHSFVRDGDEKEIVEVWVDGTQGKNKLTASVKAGLKDLLILKSSGSSFENFHLDEFTTLKPASDRIFSTSVDSSYTFAPPPTELLTIASLGKLGEKYNFPTVATNVKATTLEVFADEDSASVQATLYNTAEKVIEQNPLITDITYKLPNKHYIPVDMSYYNGTQNVSPPEVAEVFTPVAAPSGFIEATVSRD